MIKSPLLNRLFVYKCFVTDNDDDRSVLIDQIHVIIILHLQNNDGHHPIYEMASNQNGNGGRCWLRKKRDRVTDLLYRLLTVWLLTLSRTSD
jgi:hypothetical protein